MTPAPSWFENAQQMQQQFADYWLKSIQMLPSAFTPQGAAPTSAPVQFDTARLQEIQKKYLEDVSRLCNGGLTNPPTVQGDRRFGDASWQQNPLAAFTVAAYMLNAQALSGMAEAVQGDEKTRQRIRFAVEQWVAAMSPSNFLALNPEALQKAIATKGESLARGMQNLLHDIEQGHVSMTDESRFEVGRNVATTEGAVVYENDIFQLLEYKPLTEQVHERPLLMVPPCINKFYILDLQPDNSFIRYAVSQGHRTFVISWRNPDASLGHLTWDDYIGEAVIRAIDTVRAITGADRINTLGFCVGGTMLATALAVLAGRGLTGSKSPVASATLLTTLIDFSDTGVLDVFVDEATVQMRELQMGKRGLMPGRDLASTFSFLRPNDLVWNYVVGNYLKGETPPPFDLLYWNCDSTNLPGPWYVWYLRNTYLENKLMQPGALTVCGVPVDMGRVDVPMYIYGSREDHIVPIGAAWAATRVLTGSKKRFVMGASGHIAGVINPVSKNKRSHWLPVDAPTAKNPEKLPATLDEWLQTAQEHPGSWWTDWAAWLGSHAGKPVAAPTDYGDGQTYTVIEAAPGRYVRQKA